MPFLKMPAAKCVALVVAMATVARVREEFVLVFVVANPPTAAFGSREILGAAAQTTAAVTDLACFTRI
jgi:hypothetical protein